MRDLEASRNFNYSKFNSNGWQNFAFDDASEQLSVMPKHSNANHQASILHFQSLLNQPPRPPASIYNCLQSDQEEQQDIKEVQYLPNEPQAKRVNSKQYFRMMKRRIKKVMNQFQLAQGKPAAVKQDSKTRPRYLYESRHQHAARRPRGKDGKFLATRPEQQRFKQKKKRGRKPKILMEMSTLVESNL